MKYVIEMYIIALPPRMTRCKRLATEFANVCSIASWLGSASPSGTGAAAFACILQLYKLHEKFKKMLIIKNILIQKCNYQSFCIVDGWDAAQNGFGRDERADGFCDCRPQTQIRP